MRMIVIACLLALLVGCTGAQRVVTRTVQVDRWRTAPIDPRLLPKIEAPIDPASVRNNGDLWRAWTHDAGELGKCRPALEGIRALQH